MPNFYNYMFQTVLRSFSKIIQSRRRMTPQLGCSDGDRHGSISPIAALRSATKMAIPD